MVTGVYSCVIDNFCPFIDICEFHIRPGDIAVQRDFQFLGSEKLPQNLSHRAGDKKAWAEGYSG